jgi:hypothetical protein
MEIRSGKRHSTEETARTPKKAALPASTVKVAKNFFAPLRTTNMDPDAPGAESNSAEETVQGKSGTPLPIVLTSATNLIQLHKQLKGVAKQIF